MRYNTKEVPVEVVSTEMNPLYLVGGGVLLLLILWQLYVRVISKMMKKKGES